jgi:hypothetical protein
MNYSGFQASCHNIKEFCLLGYNEDGGEVDVEFFTATPLRILT